MTHTHTHTPTHTHTYHCVIDALVINSWLIRLSVDNVLLISTRRLSILIDKPIPPSIGISTSAALPLLSLSRHNPFRPHLISSGTSFHKVKGSSTKPALPTPLSKICTLHLVIFWSLLPCVVSLPCIALYFPCL